MADWRRDLNLRTRLTSDLDAIQPPTPDPARARYATAPPVTGHGPAFRGVGLGFVGGAAAVCGALILLTGSVQPQVWLNRAAGGVRQFEESLVESREPAPSQTAAPTPSPVPTLIPAPPPIPQPASGATPAVSSLVPTVVSSDHNGGEPGGAGHDGGTQARNGVAPTPDSGRGRDGTPTPGFSTPAPSPSLSDSHGGSVDDSHGGSRSGGSPSPQPSPSPSASADISGRH